MIATLARVSRMTYKVLDDHFTIEKASFLYYYFESSRERER